MKLHLAFILFLSFQSSSYAGEGPLASTLDPIFLPVERKGIQLGVEVTSLRSGKKLYSLHGDRMLTPASGIKVVTAWAALEKFGPGHVFKTEVLTTGKLNGSTLSGDLILKGGGDPSLVIERLFLLAREVSRKGIKKVTGSIRVDASAFDEEKFGEERVDSDSDRAYNAPVSGLSLNYNSITLKVSAGRMGSPPKVSVDPDTGYLQIKNLAKTGKRGSPYTLRVSRADGALGDQVTLSGNFPVNLSEQTRYVAITQPDIYAGKVFCSLLKQSDVSVSCSSILRSKGVAATELASLESFPLREIVVLMNKFSNNFIAESLVKALGHELTQLPGTARDGLEAIRKELKGAGFEPTSYTIVSGSGLTDQNRFSAAQFNRLLLSSYGGMKSFPELVSSFPLAGVDGTLRSKFKDSSVTGLLRAKTGSINGVVSLVGIVPTEAGDVLAFSVLLNDAQGRTDRSWEEGMARVLRGYR